jgi:sRNA-binding protein
VAVGLIALAARAAGGAATLSDPTRPYSTARHEPRQTQPAGSYVLNSTLVSPHRRVAVINGLHVTEGETVGDATVLEIHKQDVLLQSPNRRITLQLLPDIVRKP